MDSKKVRLKEEEVMHDMAQHMAGLGLQGRDRFLHGAQDWGSAEPPNPPVPFCSHLLHCNASLHNFCCGF